jgi:hypothetical protein
MTQYETACGRSLSVLRGGRGLNRVVGRTVRVKHAQPHDTQGDNNSFRHSFFLSGRNLIGRLGKKLGLLSENLYFFMTG